MIPAKRPIAVLLLAALLLTLLTPAGIGKRPSVH